MAPVRQLVVRQKLERRVAEVRNVVDEVPPGDKNLFKKKLIEFAIVLTAIVTIFLIVNKF